MGEDTTADALARPPLWKWLLATVLSLGMLSVLFWWVDWDDLEQALARADRGLLAAAAATFVGTLVARYLRTLVLAKAANPAVQPGAVLGVSAGHGFLNKLLPFRTGELTFPILFRRATGADLSAGLAYLGVLRIADLVALVPLYLGAVFTFTGGPAGLVWSAGSLLSTAVIVGLPAVFARLAARLPRDPVSRVGRVLVSAEGALQKLRRRDTVLLAVSTFAAWMSLFVVFHLTVRAFAIEIPFSQTVTASGGGIATNLLPVNALGSVGTLEAGWTAGFAATGVDMAPAVMAGVAMHVLVIALTGVAAGLGFLRLFQARAPGVEHR